MQRPLLTAVFAGFAFMTTLGIGLVNADSLTASLFSVSLFGEKEEPVVALELESVTEGDKDGEWTYCDMTIPEAPQYNAELQSVTVSEGILPGSVFTVDMEFKNTGDTRLFSVNSGCGGDVPALSVGTQKSQDRRSDFGTKDNRVSGWSANNRIAMSDAYADPGETFHVTFESIAPEGDDVYREFFQPVVEGRAWVGEIFSIDIAVGTPTEEMLSNIEFVQDMSMPASELSGLERNILIDLSEQEMYARFGETTVWTMQISSGAWDTPTPPGSYEILTKQELRIGSKSPHYRMPYFQLWDYRGYGIHALPYLESDGGVFWTEALSHIGIPVSHGCIRTLPEDAVQVYEFTTIGTPVNIQS